MLGRLCEPAFIYDCMRKACETMQSKLESTSWVVDHSEESMQRLERFGLLSMYEEPNRAKVKSLDLKELFWMIVQYTLLTTNALRTLFNMFTSSGMMPDREETEIVSKIAPPSMSEKMMSAMPQSDPLRAKSQRRAMMDYNIWPTAGTLFSLPSRMPWFTGLLSLIHRLALSGKGRVGRTNGRIDRCVTLTKPCWCCGKNFACQ